MTVESVFMPRSKPQHIPYLLGEERYQALAQIYPFFAAPLKAVDDYSSSDHLSSSKRQMFLSYSLWTDYPQAIPGISYFIGVSERTIKSHIDTVENKYLGQWDKIDEVLENLRDLEAKTHEELYPESVQIKPPKSATISRESLMALREHSQFLKAQGYSPHAIIVETLFSEGYASRVSKSDFSYALGISRERIRQICGVLEEAELPLPAQLTRPRGGVAPIGRVVKPNGLIPGTKGALFEPDVERIVKVCQISKKQIGSEIAILHALYPNEFIPQQGESWQISSTGISLLSEKLAKLRIPPEYTRVSIKALCGELKTDGENIKRKLMRFCIENPEYFRKGDRENRLYATSEGLEAFKAALKRRNGFSLLNMTDVAQEVGRSATLVAKIAGKYAKLYPQDISPDVLRGVGWWTTAFGREIIKNAVSEAPTLPGYKQIQREVADNTWKELKSAYPHDFKGGDSGKNDAVKLRFATDKGALLLEEKVASII